MSWRKVVASLRQRFGLSKSRTEQDIDDELVFHLRQSVEDRLEEGLSPDAAWHEARARFGSIVSAAESCRRSTSRRLVHPTVLAALVASALTLMLGWLMVEVRSLRADRLARGDDLRGMILDRRGAPIADAQVLVVLKTWPGGWFRQDSFFAASDRDGHFRLPGLLPRTGQFAVQLSALHDGYAWESTYQLHEEDSGLPIEPVIMRLGEATKITLVVRDAEGRLLPNVRVAPASRRTREGLTHLVYFQACEPVQVASNDQGEITLSCFEQGDVGDIFLQSPDGDWQRHSVAITGKISPVVVSAVSDSEPHEDSTTAATHRDQG